MIPRAVRGCGVLSCRRYPIVQWLGLLGLVPLDVVQMARKDVVLANLLVDEHENIHPVCSFGEYPPPGLGTGHAASASRFPSVVHMNQDVKAMSAHTSQCVKSKHTQVDVVLE